MARQHGAGIKAWGVSNSLQSKGFDRSKQINVKDRKDQRMSAGYKSTTIDENTVRLEHTLGVNHRIVSAADRVKIISDHLDKYADALSGSFRVERQGTGEHAYLTLRLHPEPMVGEALRKAADKLEKQGMFGPAVVEELRAWAKTSDAGEDW